MEHPMVEQATLTIDKQYPHATGDLFALLVAHELFNQLRTQTCNGPQSTFTLILHAQKRVDRLIAEMCEAEHYAGIVEP